MKSIEAKVVILGTQGVGKTSLICRYVRKQFNPFITPTIGASFFSAKVIIDDIRVKLQVWDTAGQERFRSMAPMYYRNANAALLVFDISNRESFQHVEMWGKELQKNIPKKIVLTLVGNKTDLEEKRAVKFEEAILMADKLEGKYLETSCLNDEGIDEVFYATAKDLATSEEFRESQEAGSEVGESVIIPSAVEAQALKPYYCC